MVEALNESDAPVGTYTVDRRGRVCLPVREHGRYTVYRLRITRGKAVKPPLQVHFKTGPQRRILGVVRKER